MAKETVTEPTDPEKQRRLADELLKEFENLPAEVRRSIAVHATAPNVLEHVAGGLQQTLDDLGQRAQARGDPDALSRRTRAPCATRHASLRWKTRGLGMGS